MVTQNQQKINIKESNTSLYIIHHYTQASSVHDTVAVCKAFCSYAMASTIIAIFIASSPANQPTVHETSRNCNQSITIGLND